MLSPAAFYLDLLRDRYDNKFNQLAIVCILVMLRNDPFLMVFLQIIHTSLQDRRCNPITRLKLPARLHQRIKLLHHEWAGKESI